MVSLRRQELIILLRHSFRSLNVDPDTSSYGIDFRDQGNRHCCSSLPVRHQRIYTFWRCGEHRVFIIRDEFRFSSFRRYLTVGLCSTFAVSVYVAAIVVEPVKTACPCSLVFAVPLGSRTKFSELAVSVTSLSFNRLLLASVTVTLYVCLVLPSATARLPITSILEMVAVVYRPQTLQTAHSKAGHFLPTP